MICCGWALQMLRAMPDVWEKRYEQQFADDVRAYVEDPLPGGKKLAAPSAQVDFGEATISLGGTRTALVLEGTFASDSLAIKVFSRPDAQGSHTVVSLQIGGEATAVNDRGERLLMEGSVEPEGAASRFVLRIPYTVVKEQKPWLNGVEHGRYSISVGESVRNFYLAGRREQVEARLEHELGAGLRTWQAIFREKGYIPTGINAGFIWGGISDSGGYAHLISACAQWLLYVEHKSDWKTHHVPAGSDP